MDCNCNCFGIAASSKRPVKRYNLLVPEIFPKKSPPFAAKLDVSTERKLKKLFEYLEKNLHRGPKVSHINPHLDINFDHVMCHKKHQLCTKVHEGDCESLQETACILSDH